MIYSKASMDARSLARAVLGLPRPQLQAAVAVVGGRREKAAAGGGAGSAGGAAKGGAAMRAAAAHAASRGRHMGLFSSGGIARRPRFDGSVSTYKIE